MRGLTAQLVMALAHVHSVGLARLLVGPPTCVTRFLAPIPRPPFLPTSSQPVTNPTETDLDLKPQNMLVRPVDMAIMLIDFGSAHSFEVSGANARRVKEHGGTQNYMSPERHFEDYEEDEGFDGPAADVYSVGCILFFMLQGYAPFDWEACREQSCAHLIERIKANDPFGGREREEECDDEEDEPPPAPSSQV